jgi:hypothetical protein
MDTSARKDRGIKYAEGNISRLCGPTKWTIATGHTSLEFFLSKHAL